MRLPAFGRSRVALAPGARGALGALGVGRALAVARDVNTDGLVVATPSALVVVGDRAADVRLNRPWLDVAAASWEPTTRTISVTWVDGSRAAQWTFGDGDAPFAAVFHERVAASVVVDSALVADGRDLGRAAIRRDLASGELLRQVVRARGVRADDERFAGQARAVLDDLAERVGLPPA